jgi:transcription termination factor Rho
LTVAELEGRPLADLHQLAAAAGVPRYRLLRKEQLVAALSGEEVAPPAATATAERPPRERDRPAPQRPRRERERPDRPRRERPERPQRQERQERAAPVPSLEELEGGKRASSFDDLPAQRPSRTLPLGDALPMRMLQIVAPVGHGQRALLAGPPASGATALLREVGRGIAGAGVRVTVLLIDVRPEEVPEWDGELDVSAADSGSSPREQVALAERALEDAKRAAERGEDTVLLIDSLSRLARAYALAGSDRGEAVEAAKRWFAAARDAGAGRGSLTLIAAARVESDSSFETLVHETLEDSASMVVRLSSELAARGMHPAIDTERSRTLGEEALLDDQRRRDLENMRGVARSLDPPEAWEFLAERARENA